MGRGAVAFLLSPLLRREEREKHPTSPEGEEAASYRPRFLFKCTKYVIALVHTVAAFLFVATGNAQTKTAAQTNSPPPPIILTIEGTNVFVRRNQQPAWESARLNQVLAAKDRGRTGARSRTSVRLSDLSVLRVAQFSEFEIQPLPDPNVEAEFSLFRGLMYLLNRDRPGKHRFVTPTATAATRGTEFTIEVDEATGRTVLTVLEGEAELSNAQGSVRVSPGQQGIAVLGQIPTTTAVIDTTNVVQWCLYYPGVLDLQDLELADGERAAISSSLDAYRSGDLLRAVASYPAERVPGSDSERAFLAALLLSVGQVAQAEEQLGAIARPTRPGRPQRLADALHLVVAAVKGRALSTPVQTFDPPLATELLARSYYEQSEKHLEEALALAREAVRRSPNFGFGWARVAELEFSFGRTKRAFAALETSLSLAPRNAQAVALNGFLLSAQNRIKEAQGHFDRAIELDGGLGNAWLGRGLSRIRQGNAREGRFDLQVAATTEPRRSLLRSYLGKAFSNAGEHRKAEKELRLAQEIDAGDPTPWLYSALLLQQENRVNDAVEDLQRAQELNENRAVFRSQLLLDQDRAVAGANLANVYRDAGMMDVSVREAGRAVVADYANYSSHVFLANSFNELRDPNRINLRYETPWFTEYLVANLLAPVGAGNLSQTVSQQDYSKLFERDRLRIAYSGEYRSNGDWWQSAALQGTTGNSSYALDGWLNIDNGDRPNNELSQMELALSFKQQLSPQDSVFLRASYYQSDAGDVNHYYDQSDANLGLSTRQRQDPMILGGYHREWGPGSHTLLLIGRANAEYEIDDPRQTSLFHFVTPAAQSVSPLLYDQEYSSEVDIYTAELQQIWQVRQHTFVGGGRVQAGEYATKNQQTDGRVFDGTNFLGLGFPISQSVETGFDRESVYLYDHWQFWPSLLLVGGVVYDRLTYPENFRHAPVTEGHETRDKISPKAGVVFTPFQDTVLRGAYYEGLGGVSIEQSIRLEPSQVGGFNQAYRSLIPEAVAGANEAPEFETWAVSLEQKFKTKTFLSLSGEILSSAVSRQIGGVQFTLPPVPPSPFSIRQTRQTLDYRERSLSFVANQLLGSEWAFGAAYRISHAELDSAYSGIPAGTTTLGGISREQSTSATLQQVHLSLLYNHASGLFSRAGAVWTTQSNFDYEPDIPGDDFWQFNIEVGWRFFRRRLEARVALLNITDQDYKLNPLNLTQELPRERTLAAGLSFNF